eukprot:CAMPEP_0184550760 /NCGR_PEP_ID=MMETSP0199_2-20130426/21969_1 /TAXON_ID=1112570 /ORGANISM="Thraustochytrium sp., Strain LLF1b" /LENGTH=802 /DNA_ID=CAMNT_0026945733 /DNA_START=46 /DNA_END=2451 /DNA_ORIENTATION=+
MRVLAAGAIAATVVGTSEAVSVWTEVVGKVPETTNPRLTQVPFSAVAVNHDALAAALQVESPALEFELPDRSLSCTLTNSGVMHPDLAAKFPNLKSLSGSCLDGTDVSLNMDTDTEGSLQATFYTPDGMMYADIIENGVYMVYSHKEAKAKGVAPEGEFKCEVDAEVSRRLEKKLRGVVEPRKAQTTVQGYKFRIALLANRQYGAFHGGTESSIMLALVNTMTRVNGVYIRELGVFFELIADNDKLICVTGDSSCSSWPNDSSLINQNEGLMSARGVTSSMYDIGHSVSTASGGVAGYPAFCTGSKARGTTGVNQPIGDPFWVDYVAHEIGHQLLGAHTFRDCNGPSDGNLMNEGAVEPGGGTTIMGYAGICGGNNVQANSDPNFNGINLEAMRGLIDSRVAGGCGEVFDVAGSRPVMETNAGTCVVPKGNYVQLAGRVANLPADSVKYAWDRVDLGYEDYTNTNVARFRPWGPGSSPARFLPNMYYLTFGLGSQLGELPPKDSVSGDKTMTFRFIGRTKYERDAEQSSFDPNSIGAFGFVDTNVRYDSSEAPLTITSSLSSLTVGASQQISWTGGSLASTVEIMIAVNTMTEVNDFRYEDDVKDLDWVSVAVVQNTGSATVTIPQVANSANQEVNLMIRSTGNEDCYFFDLVPRLSFVGGTTGTAPPTEEGTTAPPAVVPTLPPVTPTPAPTSVWSCPASWFGASDGCDCGCGGGDPDCDAPFTVLYCSNVRTDPDEFRCDPVTDSCISASGTRPNVEGGEQKGETAAADDNTTTMIAAVAGSVALVAGLVAAVFVRNRKT